jgi:hypothetical protein
MNVRKLKLMYLLSSVCFMILATMREVANGQEGNNEIHPKFDKFDDMPSKYPIEDETPDKWNKLAHETLAHHLNKRKNTRIAKNLILFVGDGMGITTITAGLKFIHLN